MDKKEMRLQKLKDLVAEYGDHRALCREFPDLSPDQIYQYLKGIRGFTEKAADKIAIAIGRHGYFDAELSDSQKLILALCKGFSPDQIAQLSQAATWIREGRTVSSSDPPVKTKGGVTETTKIEARKL